MSNKDVFVLSPLLFNLFVNDLSHCFEKEKCAPIAFGDLFVNFSYVCGRHSTVIRVKKGLHNCLSSLRTYCDLWHLKIHTEKTKVIIFNKSGKLFKKYRFFLNDVLLENDQEYKYLGLLMSASGTFTNTIQYLSNKALKVIL